MTYDKMLKKAMKLYRKTRIEIEKAYNKALLETNKAKRNSKVIITEV